MDVVCPNELGVIALLQKTFGFIACPHRTRDVFFHISALEDCTLEQLQSGTAVSFTAETEPNGKAVAKHIRLAPVGTRVQMTRLEPGMCVGLIADPAVGGVKGVVRFIDDNGAPDHLLFDAEETDFAVNPGSPDGVAPPDAVDEAPTPQPPKQAQGPLAKGQMVLFRILTDVRAAQRAREVVARGGAAPKRMAYQRAVGVRPATEAELADHPMRQRQAVLLELLQGALEASREVKDEVGQRG